MQADGSTLGATTNGELFHTAGGGLQLVVMDHGCLSRVHLPARGSLRIGRAEDSDIVVSDRAASRLHAVLHVGSTLEVVDLASHNGTRVKNQTLLPHQPTVLAPGDSIHIGQAVLVVQPAVSMAQEFAARKRVGDPARIVVAAPAMRAVFELVERVAASRINVLILGETGVGKEVIAESIHRASGPRSQGPFVRINCAALSESLFESELFGHQQGSFTGALRAKTGLIQTADRGTLFLDEVGEIPLAMQAKLLRVIEARELTPVGALKPVPLDVRFVCATNRDLRLETQMGRFREDLFFRLNGCAIAVPPLRERVSEIEPLVAAFLRHASGESERPVARVSNAAMQLLLKHPWPGNVRELRNAVEYALLFANGAQIEPEHLPASVHGDAPPLEPEPRRHAVTRSIPPFRVPREADLQRCAEIERISQALEACNGNQTRAAVYLGMPRRTLVAKLAAYDMPRPRKFNPAEEG